MANRNLSIEKAEVRKLYFSGIKSPVMLAKILDLPRQTIAAWITRENWERDAATENVSTMEIAQQVMKIVRQLLNEVEEKKEAGEQISMLTVKELLGFTRALRQLDEDYDVRGSLVHWSSKYINFVSALSNESLPQAERKAFVAALQRTMPLFLKSQDQ